MTIHIVNSWLDRLLNRFGYHRHVELPGEYQELKDKFGPYINVRVKGDVDLGETGMLMELALMADKLKAVALSIEGLNDLSGKDMEVATAGLASIVADLSIKVTMIHAAYEKECWSRKEANQ
jgi:hypothetical protein